MKLLNIILFISLLVISNVTKAHSIDCANFYAKASDFELDLRELKRKFYPLSDSKQQYLENLEYSIRSYSKEADKVSLYSDSDYEQFKIVKRIDRLLEKAENFKRKNTWSSDKELLVKAANGNFDSYKNQWGNDAYENLGAYILASNDVALFVSDFSSYSSEWKRTRRVLPLETIQWVEMRVVPFLYTYTHIANCHAQFLSFETNDVVKRIKK